MQLVDGKSLRQLLDVQTRLSPELTIHIGTCVALPRSTPPTHAGFVHRDVKPGNILVTPDGRVLLTDFGIAKGLDTTGDDLTSDNVMMGTAKYLSPSRCAGASSTGAPTSTRWASSSTSASPGGCRSSARPTPTPRSPACSATRPTSAACARRCRRRSSTLIHRLLARNPNHRPATGAELRAELQRVADEPPPDLSGLVSSPLPADMLDHAHACARPASSRARAPSDR